MLASETWPARWCSWGRRPTGRARSSRPRTVWAAPWSSGRNAPGLSASRGVLRADDPSAFVASFRRVAEMLRGLDPSPDAELLVEGYVPGDEVAVEGLLTGGRLRVLAVFDKPDPLEGPTFEETIYVTPSRLPAPPLESLESAARRLVAALGLTQGAVHAELRINEAGPW